MTRSPHWFEAVADHLGDAYLRYSFTKGTENEADLLVEVLGLQPASVVLDVGCGPGRHVAALRRRGVHAFGVDISMSFVRLAAAGGLAVVRGDARALPVRPGSCDAVISLCQGGFGLPALEQGAAGPGDCPAPDDRQILRAMADAARPGGMVALSAFSAYFQLRYFEPERECFHAGAGVNQERTEIRSPAGDVASTDLWTACYTPRELRLLSELAGLDVVGLWSVTPGDYRRTAPTTESAEFLLVARKP